MQYKNYTDPIINNYRRNEKGIKQSKRIDSEVHKIVNSKVALSEIPDEEQVLKIEGYDETKVKETVLGDKQFRVDYTNGFIYFSPSQDGATVDVSYFGLGVTYFPASRVWLEVDGENNVEKTLADVQGGIAEAKKLSASQEQLKKDIDEQGGKLKEIIDEVQKVDLTEIEKTAKGAKQAEDNLKSATSEAEAKIANINETKKQLDTSIQSAKDEGQSLNDKIEQSKANKAEIDGACEKLKQATNSVDGSVKKAQDAVSAIDEKVNTGNQIKDELDKSTQQANEASSSLSKVKQEANQVNNELIASQKTADKTKTDLEALKSESTSLSSDLDEKNTEAKENIEGLKSQNKQAKDNIAGLQNESKVAVEKKDSLLSENTKASQTIEQIETLIQSSTDLKNRLEEIIASGDLGKYVTDPKLQNILTSYATKDDLSKIDLTEKLTEYAKTVDVNKQVASLTSLIDNKVDKVDGYGLSKNDYTDVDKAKVKAIPDNPKYTDTVPDLSGYATKSSIPTSLSQLTDDTTHRLVTDDEKNKWNNPPNPDLSGYAKLKNGEVPAENLPTMGNNQAGIVPAKDGKFLSIFADQLTDMSSGNVCGIEKTPLGGGRVHLNPIRQLPSGGTTGQILMKTQNGSTWANNLDLRGYVKKEENKQLSTNDYTNEDKEQVASIPEYLKKKDLQTQLYNLSINHMKVEEITYENLRTNEYKKTEPDYFERFIRRMLEDITSVHEDISYLYAKTKSLSDTKVNKVNGKQLSTNDFTNDYKSTVDTLKDTAISITPRSSEDLNILTKAGFYSCRGGRNFPPGAGSYGTLIVSKADTTTDNSQTDTVQLYVDQYNNVYIRNSIDKTNAWTSWTQLGGHATKILTESEYNGLSTKDADTLYFIK